MAIPQVIEILFRVEHCITRLIESHPGLQRFSVNLSTEDLVQLLHELGERVTLNLLLDPPADFTFQVRQFSPRGEWAELLALIGEWEVVITTPSKPSLLVPEREYLATALIWGTLLIYEYGFRTDARPRVQ